VAGARINRNRTKREHLQGDKPVANEDLLGEEISTDRGLVLLAELLAHVSSHGQANLSISQYGEYLEGNYPKTMDIYAQAHVSSSERMKQRENKQKLN
jgi:hypothetical protein